MNIYCGLADAVLAIHVAYVAFVIVGLAAILLGAALHWAWVRNFWFRMFHFAMIAVVVLESLFGILCPLTEWEDRLREAGGETVEPSSFIGRWLDALLFVDLSPAILTTCYCAFGVAVLAALFFAPPRWPWNRRK